MKHKLYLFFTFCAMLSLLAACQPIQPSGAQPSTMDSDALKQMLIAKEQAFLDCSVTYDVAGCDALLAQDHFWVDNLGNRNSRQSYLDLIGDKNITSEPVQASDWVVTLNSPTFATVSYKYEQVFA